MGCDAVLAAPILGGHASRNSAFAHCCNPAASATDCAILAGMTSPPRLQYASAEDASRRSYTRVDNANRCFPSCDDKSSIIMELAEKGLTLPWRIANSSFKIFSYSDIRRKTTSGSYRDDPAKKRMDFRRARLCSEFGVVEAKYDRNDESLLLDAYDDAF